MKDPYSRLRFTHDLLRRHGRLFPERLREIAPLPSAYRGYHPINFAPVRSPEAAEGVFPSPRHKNGRIAMAMLTEGFKAFT